MKKQRQIWQPAKCGPSLVLFWLLLAFSFQPSAFATQYWIQAQSGNDSNSGTSSSTPWQTFAHLNYGGGVTLQPGDVVKIGGVFNHTSDSTASSMQIANFNGTSSAPIIFTNWGFMAISNSGPNVNTMQINTCSWLKFVGLTSTNAYRTPDFQGDVNCEITGCAFGDTMNSQNGSLNGPATFALNCQSNWIHGNVFGPSITFFNSSGDAGQHGVVFGTYFVGSPYDYTSCNIIESNTFWGGGHDTLGLYGQSNLVQYNWTYSPPIWGFSQAPYYYGSRGFDIGGYLGSWNVVQYNSIGYCGMDTDAPGALTIDNGGLNLVRFNSIFGAAYNAIQIYGKGGAGPAGSNYILNNSVMLSSYAISWTYPGNALSNYVTNVTWQYPMGFASTSNNMVVNNLLYANFQNAWSFLEGPSVDMQVCLNNLTNVNPLWQTTNSGLLLRQPPYAPMTPPVFSLPPGSPAIAAGKWPATIASASGAGTSFTVNDARWFFAGMQAASRTVPGDTIQLQGQAATAVIAAITGNTITVSTSLTWTNGQGVALPYYGTAPDVGSQAYQPQLALGGTGQATFIGSKTPNVIVTGTNAP